MQLFTDDDCAEAPPPGKSQEAHQGKFRASWMGCWRVVWWRAVGGPCGFGSLVGLFLHGFVIKLLGGCSKQLLDDLLFSVASVTSPDTS